MEKPLNLVFTDLACLISQISRMYKKFCVPMAVLLITATAQAVALSLVN